MSWSWSEELLTFGSFHLLLFSEREGQLEDPGELLLVEDLSSALVLLVSLHLLLLRALWFLTVNTRPSRFLTFCPCR